MTLLGEWGRSASWSANISSNSRNLKLTFFTTRCHGRVHLPVDLSILALIEEISNWHSWPLDDSTGGGRVDLPLDLLILAIIVEISNCHSSPINNSTWGVGTYASWSANNTSNSRNLKLPFLATRWLYWGGGVDLPVDLSILALIVEISNHHSWPLDDSTWGSRSASWSANISSNSRNLILPILGH